MLLYRIENDEVIQEFTHESSSFVSKMWLPTDVDITQSPRDLWDQLYLSGVHIRTPEPTKTLNIVDMFSGAGGLSFGVSEGLKSFGFSPNFTHAIDTDENALSIHRHNLGTTYLLCENVETLVDYRLDISASYDDFQSKPTIHGNLKSAIGQNDILVAGPPCQGFSNLNNKTRRKDDRNELYFRVPAAAIALGSKIVIIENVKEILADPRKIIERAIYIFERNGYSVSTAILDGAKIGLPQTRKRHFLIAVKGKVTIDFDSIISAMTVRHARTVDWAIGDLRSTHSTHPYDAPSVLSSENQTRIALMQDLQEIPKEFRPKSHRDADKLTYKSVYGRLWGDRPSGTITTGFYTPGRGRYIHPQLPRALTAHEAARLQGFPDRFEFLHHNGTIPTRNTYAKTIGDAVPPLFGFIAALVALKSHPKT